MNGLLLDTHAFVWYLAFPEKLSQPSSDAIGKTLKQGSSLYISSITIVEIIYLVEKGKIPEEGLELLLQKIKEVKSAIKVLPIDLNVAEKVRNIPREQIPDMPDRIIAAVASNFNMPLITKDKRIINADIITIW